MLQLLIFPLLILSLPTWLQVRFTFRHLHAHSATYLWLVFLLAMFGQILAGILATVVSLHGIVQTGETCATGVEVFTIIGILLALVATPWVALVAVDKRNEAPEPPARRVGL